MALKDFKKYLVNVGAQYTEMKADLQDYEQAVKDGHFTEEQLAEIKEEIQQIQSNYQRLLYVDYLLGIPKKPGKHQKYVKTKGKLLEYLTGNDEDSVKNENKTIMCQVRKELKNLTDKSK